MKTCLVCVLVLSVGSAFAQRVKENVKVRQGSYKSQESSKSNPGQSKPKSNKRPSK